MPKVARTWSWICGQARWHCGKALDDRGQVNLSARRFLCFRLALHYNHTARPRKATSPTDSPLHDSLSVSFGTRSHLVRDRLWGNLVLAVPQLGLFARRGCQSESKKRLNASETPTGPRC